LEVERPFRLGAADEVPDDEPVLPKVIVELRFPNKEEPPQTWRRRRPVGILDEGDKRLPSGVLSPTGKELRVLGLLGRDFLAGVRFEYDGARQRLEFRFKRA